jgi:phage regulator Rha-like protein
MNPTSEVIQAFESMRTEVRTLKKVIKAKTNYEKILSDTIYSLEQNVSADRTLINNLQDMKKTLRSLKQDISKSDMSARVIRYHIDSFEAYEHAIDRAIKILK